MTFYDRLPLIFVAGPYRAATEWGVLSNIRDAESAALKLWQMGFAVHCPHKNTAFFGGAADDAVWLRGDQEILRRCDVVYALPQWKKSSGASSEIALANSLNIPVIYTFEEAERFLSLR